MLAVRPDLKVGLIRGNVQTRLSKVKGGEVAATMLALAGLKRMELAHEATVVLDPDAMVPAAGQGIVGVTVRADDTELHELLAAIEDREATAVSTAERALLAASRRLLPHADRRPCPAAAGWRAAPDRPGCPARWLLPAQADGGRQRQGCGAARIGAGREPSAGFAGGHLHLILRPRPGVVGGDGMG